MQSYHPMAACPWDGAQLYSFGSKFTPVIIIAGTSEQNEPRSLGPLSSHPPLPCNHAVLYLLWPWANPGTDSSQKSAKVAFF